MLTKEPWIVHLAALRVCLLHVFAAIFIIFLLLSGFSDKIYHLVALPLLQQMPKGEHIIATTIVSPFFAPIKLNLFIALFIAMPYIIWRIWCYVSPALYKTEQRFSIILLSSALPIFYAGVAINYFLVAPHRLYLKQSQVSYRYSAI